MMYSHKQIQISRGILRNINDTIYFEKMQSEIKLMKYLVTLAAWPNNHGVQNRQMASMFKFVFRFQNFNTETWSVD